MLCTLPEHAVGIRAYGRRVARDAFALPRCARTALHGIAEGEWELAPLVTPIPHGWRQVSDTLMKRTIWERVTP